MLVQTSYLLKQTELCEKINILMLVKHQVIPLVHKALEMWLSPFQTVTQSDSLVSVLFREVHGFPNNPDISNTICFSTRKLSFCDSVAYVVIL